MLLNNNSHMKIKLSIALAASVMVFGFTQVKAQTEPPRVMEKTGTPPSPAAIKAAEEMLIASGASDQFNKNIKTVVDQYSAQMPGDKRVAFVKVMNDFFDKYISWDSLKQDMCIMYAREFSEAELKQLTVFYKTPLGIKLNQKQPVLMQAGMTIGQQSVIAHQAELQQMIEDAVK
jgi:hypothetical protein